MKIFLFIFYVLFVACEKSNDSTASDESNVSGCMDISACNYNDNATINDGSCIYSEANYDCNGECSVNIDCQGVCGGLAVNCPVWIDDPGLYLYSATYVGVIITNITMNFGDILAAFDSNGNVRGVALQLVPPFGPYQGTIVYELQVRSNTNGDEINFKYYDKENDIIWDIVETYQFNIDQIMGNVIEPIMFSVINK